MSQLCHLDLAILIIYYLKKSITFGGIFGVLHVKICEGLCTYSKVLESGMLVNTENTDLTS